jgi:ABC-2 type transport system ATP-binding protein
VSASIRFESVSKRYVLDNSKMLVSRLVPGRRRGLAEVWALRDVSFEIEEGETVAIVGTNGSGKTTTLRLIGGISSPSSGTMRVTGNVAPLIGVGVGFNPELTGRENVYVNGQLLGMTLQEVKSQFDAIVAFSELEAYLDTPVKFYSSGMFLRLGFSVAVHMRPEILVVDEILAVGDAGFQAKCNERMRELREAGTTVVLVTHNLGLAVQMAKRAIVLSKGELVFDGGSAEGMGVYHDMLSKIRDARGTAPLSNDGGEDLAEATVSIEMLDEHGNPTRSLATDSRFTIVVKAEFTHDVEDPCIGVGIMVANGSEGLITSAFTSPGEYRGSHGPGRPLIAKVEMDNRLLTRDYTMHAEVSDRDGRHRLGMSPRESFFVNAGVKYLGTVNLGSRILINGAEMDGRLPEESRSADGRSAVRE